MSEDLGRAEMADKDGGSWRWVQNSSTKNDRVNGAVSLAYLCLSFSFTIPITSCTFSNLHSIDRQSNIKRRQHGYGNCGSGRLRTVASDGS